MEESKPRGFLGICLIGLILGPFILMMWLGRGLLAIAYLLVQLIVIGLILLALVRGFIAPVEAPFLSLPLNIVGLIHGLMICRTSLRRPWFSRWYIAFLPIALIWLIPFIVREFLYQPFSAPSGNMIPGLMVGDYFFVSKTAYGEPQRGDIVAFEHPRDGTAYVMRLIGLPNDRIQLREGVVVLNGEALALTRAEGIPCFEGERCNFFRETLPGGRSYVINNAEPSGQADNTDEYVVPAGHYFMLGDNRDNSLDSRYTQIGDIPYENLVGPVVLIYWNAYGFRIDDRLEGYPTK